jgi:hypothetical protein
MYNQRRPEGRTMGDQAASAGDLDLRPLEMRGEDSEVETEDR